MLPSEGYGRFGSVPSAIETVRAIYDAFGRRDVEGALGHIAADVTFVPSGTASRLGRTEPYRGHDGIRQYFADVAEVWEELTLIADDIRSTAEGVVVFGHVTGRSAGEPFEAPAVWIWRVRDGKAVSMRVNSLGAQSVVGERTITGDTVGVALDGSPDVSTTAALGASVDDLRRPGWWSS